MAIKAYVLLTTEPAKTKTVVAHMASVPTVKEVNEVLGPYDVVVELSIERLQARTGILLPGLPPDFGATSSGKNSLRV